MLGIFKSHEEKLVSSYQSFSNVRKGVVAILKNGEEVVLAATQNLKEKGVWILEGGRKIAADAIEKLVSAKAFGY